MAVPAVPLPPALRWQTCLCSLIPKPSHHPVLDHLQYAKTKGEGLVHFITWMTSVPTQSPQSKGRISHTHSSFWTKSVTLFAFWTFETSVLGTETTKSGLQLCSFDGEPLLPPFCLDRHWCHSCNKMNQAFPLCFCILQAIKNRTVGRPGNQASVYVHHSCTKVTDMCILQKFSIHIWLFFMHTLSPIATHHLFCAHVHSSVSLSFILFPLLSILILSPPTSKDWP